MSTLKKTEKTTKYYFLFTSFFQQKGSSNIFFRTICLKVKERNMYATGIPDEDCEIRSIVVDNSGAEEVSAILPVSKGDKKRLVDKFYQQYPQYNFRNFYLN